MEQKKKYFLLVILVTGLSLSVYGQIQINQIKTEPAPSPSETVSVSVHISGIHPPYEYYLFQHDTLVKKIDYTPETVATFMNVQPGSHYTIRVLDYWAERKDTTNLIFRKPE
jgi:hypothetical protein